MKKKFRMGAIILAGGKSTRMNGNKALLPVSGINLIEKTARTMEQYFEEIHISSSSMEIFDFLPYHVVMDEKPDMGPLMGILSGLRASRFPINFIIACDIPDINVSLIEKMVPYTEKYDVVIPFSEDNKFEPLFAFYSKRVIPIIENILAQGIRKISKLYDRCHTKYLPFEDNGWYHNLNTKKDYQKYLNSQKKKTVKG